MDKAQHRLIAGAILVGTSIGVSLVGRALVRDSPAVAAARGQLEGRWAAVRVQSAASCVAEGPNAPGSTVEFAGRTVRFTGLVDGGTSGGTYVLEPANRPAGIDCKVDAGWIRGIYRQEGDRLTLCLNQIRPLERLGVPSRGYAPDFEPGVGRFVYEFRRSR